MDDIKRINLVDIDLNSGSIHRSFLAHSIGTADSKADCFGVRVYRNGEAVSLDGGGSVQGYFRNSQGTNIAISNSSYRYISGNTAYIILPQACYNYEGPFTLAVKVINSGAGVTGTMRIVDGMVDNTNTGDAVAPTGTVPTYQEVLAVFGEMQDALEDVTEFMDGVVAPLWNGTETYSAGQYVINDGKLWRSKVDGNTNHEPPASASNTYWTRCTKGVAEQLHLVTGEIAQEYVPGNEYHVGDYVSRDRKFYRMIIQPVQPRTEWNANDWDLLDDLANDIVKNAHTTEIENNLERIVNGELPLNTEDTADVYISGKTIGSSIAFTASTKSKTYKKLIPVEEGKHYKVVITDAAEPSSVGSRDAIVADYGDIVRQVFSYTNVAGGESGFEFTASADGYLYVCTANNIENIAVFGGMVYESDQRLDQVDTDIQNHDAEIKNIYGGKTVNTIICWERGGIGSDTGENYSNATKYWRTPNYFYPDYIQKVIVPEGYQINAYLYDAETGTYSRFIRHYYPSIVDFRAFYGYKVRLLIAVADGSNITDAARELVTFVVNEQAEWKRTNEAEVKYSLSDNGIYFRNLIVPGFYRYSYGVEIANGNTSVSNTLAATDFIEIDPDNFYQVYPTITSSKYGVAFYDSTKTFISGSGMNTPADYIGVVYAPPTAKYMRASVGLSSAEGRTAYIRKASGAKPYADMPIMYYGERISFDNKCRYRLMKYVAKSTWGASQGGSIYEDELFTFANNFETGWVLNLKTKKMKAITFSGTAVDNHCNCVFMSDTFYDANDPYPLIYISSERAGYIGIYRLTVDGNEDISISEVGKIAAPDGVTHQGEEWFGNAHVDFEQGYIYYHLKLNGDDVSQLYKFKLPSAVTGTTTLEKVEYDATNHPNGWLKHFAYDTVFTQTAATANERTYRQDSFITNGKMYLGTGGRQSASLNVIDLHSGKVVSFVDLTSHNSQEIESVAKYGDTVIIYYNDGNVYQYHFD